MRLHRRQVEEHRCPTPPARPLQRRGDQIAEAADRKDVLAGEQPVVRGQAHPPTDGHRLAHQTHAQASRLLRTDCVHEEHPHVSAKPGLAHLQSSGHALRTRRLEVGE